MDEPLPPPEFLENAIVVASLAHQFAKTPKQSAEAWRRLLELKAERDRLKRAVA